MNLADCLRTTDLEPCATRFASDWKWFHGMIAGISWNEEATRELPGFLLDTVQ
jgi:hypothetical protein